MREKGIEQLRKLFKGGESFVVEDRDYQVCDTKKYGKTAFDIEVPFGGEEVIQGFLGYFKSSRNDIQTYTVITRL